MEKSAPKFTAFQLSVIIIGSVFAAISLIALIIASLAYSNTQNNVFLAPHIVSAEESTAKPPNSSKLAAPFSFKTEKEKKGSDPLILRGNTYLSSDKNDIDLFEAGQITLSVEIKCALWEVEGPSCIFSNTVGSAGQFIALIENGKFIVMCGMNSAKLENDFPILPNKEYLFNFGISNGNLWSTVNTASLKLVALNFAQNNSNELMPNYLTIGAFRRTLFDEDTFMKGSLSHLQIWKNTTQLLYAYDFSDDQNMYLNKGTGPDCTLKRVDFK